MEFSPLRLLDGDASTKLCEQVRLAREKEARRFHDNLFHNGANSNISPHLTIVSVYRRNQYTLDYSNVKYIKNLMNREKTVLSRNTCGLIKYYYEQHVC